MQSVDPARAPPRCAVREQMRLASVDGRAVSDERGATRVFAACGEDTVRLAFRSAPEPAVGLLHVTVRNTGDCVLNCQLRVAKVAGKPPNCAAPPGGPRPVPADEEEQLNATAPLAWQLSPLAEQTAELKRLAPGECVVSQVHLRAQDTPFVDRCRVDVRAIGGDYTRDRPYTAAATLPVHFLKWAARDFAGCPTDKSTFESLLKRLVRLEPLTVDFAANPGATPADFAATLERCLGFAVIHRATVGGGAGEEVLAAASFGADQPLLLRLQTLLADQRLRITAAAKQRHAAQAARFVALSFLLP